MRLLILELYDLPTGLMEMSREIYSDGCVPTKLGGTPCPPDILCSSLFMNILNSIHPRCSLLSSGMAIVTLSSRRLTSQRLEDDLAAPGNPLDYHLSHPRPYDAGVSTIRQQRLVGCCSLAARSRVLAPEYEQAQPRHHGEKT